MRQNSKYSRWVRFTYQEQCKHFKRRFSWTLCSNPSTSKCRCTTLPSFLGAFSLGLRSSANQGISRCSKDETHFLLSQYCLARTWSTQYCDRQGAMRGREVGAQVTLLTSPTDRRVILYTTIHKTGGEGTCFPFVREHCPLGIILIKMCLLLQCFIDKIVFKVLWWPSQLKLLHKTCQFTLNDI